MLVPILMEVKMRYDLYSVIAIDIFFALCFFILAFAFLRFGLKGLRAIRGSYILYIEKVCYLLLTGLMVFAGVTVTKSGYTLASDMYTKNISEVTGEITLLEADKIRAVEVYKIGKTELKSVPKEFYLKDNKRYRIKYFKDSGYIEEVFKLEDEDYRFDKGVTEKKTKSNTDAEA